MERSYFAEVVAEDIAAYGAALRRQMMLSHREALCLTMAAMGGLAAGYGVLPLVSSSPDMISYLAGCSISGITMGFLLAYARRRAWIRWAAERSFQLGSREYVLRGDELLFKSPLGTFALWLPALRKTSICPKVLLFYIDDSNAHFMPTSAFSSAEEAAAFLDLIQARMKRMPSA
jgi:hypothetical protein